jgi:hypothetical protein
METKSKTVFVEYSSNATGQHFMTIMQHEGGRRIVIGRISRLYDKTDNKMLYRAVDASGGHIFPETPDLYTLKKQFIEHGHNLAMAVKIEPKQVEGREAKLKDIREEKEERNLTKGKEL